MDEEQRQRPKQLQLQKVEAGPAPKAKDKARLFKKGASGKKVATEEKSVRATKADKDSDENTLRDVYLSRQWRRC